MISAFAASAPVSVSAANAAANSLCSPTHRFCRVHRRRRGGAILRRPTVASAGAPADSVGVLMVCLGNICRSPAAEGVLRGLINARGLSDRVHVDSCGTGGGREFWYMDGINSFHEGEPPDARMQQAAESRGLELTSRSRPLRPSDFKDFRYIVAMDRFNVEAIEEARIHWGVKKSGEEGNDSKTVLMLNYTSIEAQKDRPVPDPYYGGIRGFDDALDLIQDACNGLLDSIVEEANTKV